MLLCIQSINNNKNRISFSFRIDGTSVFNVSSQRINHTSQGMTKLRGKEKGISYQTHDSTLSHVPALKDTTAYCDSIYCKVLFCHNLTK